MTRNNFLRIFAAIFTVASVGFLLDSAIDHDDALGEVILGGVMTMLGTGWLIWEFWSKPRPSSERLL